MLLDIYGPNLSHGDAPHGESFAVHAAGCGHGKRAGLRSAIRHTEDHPSLVALCDEFYPPDDFDCESGAFAGEFYLAPCCAKLPAA